jgi:hypothetical protein
MANNNGNEDIKKETMMATTKDEPGTTTSEPGVDEPPTSPMMYMMPRPLCALLMALLAALLWLLSPMAHGKAVVWYGVPAALVVVGLAVWTAGRKKMKAQTDIRVIKKR